MVEQRRPQMTNRDDELEAAQPMLASQSVRMPWKPASRAVSTSIRYVARSIGAWKGFCCRIIAAFSRRADILSGCGGPGTMYTVPSLAAELAISTTPVREALLDLAGNGFLTPIRNRGFRVEEMTRAHLDHPFEMRALLERHTLATLAQRGLRDAAELRVLADAVAAAIQAEGGRGYLEADRTFHQAPATRHWSNAPAIRCSPSR